MKTIDELRDYPLYNYVDSLGNLNLDGLDFNEFDEVVKAWEDTIDDRLEFKNNDEGIRFIFPNGIIYEINTEQVYSNRKVFSMNVNATLYAINLTVEYLKNRQINESAKATK